MALGCVSTSVCAVTVSEMVGRWESFGRIDNDHYHQLFVLNSDRTGSFSAFLGGPINYEFSSKNVVEKQGFIEISIVKPDGVKWLLVLSLQNTAPEKKALKGVWFVFHPVESDQQELVNTHALTLLPENEHNFYSVFQSIPRARGKQ